MKNLILLLLIITLTTISNAVAETGNKDNKSTTDEFTVNFVVPVKNADIKFELKKLNSTNREPLKDEVRITKTPKEDKTIAHLTFKTNKCKTKEIIEFFNLYAPINKNTFNKSPYDLNFAAVGDITVGKETIRNVVFAQENSSEINNWWFGGPNCEYIDPKNNYSEEMSLERSVQCRADSGNIYIFSRGATNTDKFTYALGAWITGWAAPFTVVSSFDGSPIDTSILGTFTTFAVDLMNSALDDSKDENTVAMLAVEKNNKTILS
ncbi:hypothetical protein [Francisella philomiragia]|uniref:hypothetical protein n=1 Tax=Francisella philomiragia TaxID=28110 RepID=UPI001904AEA4|nr:hypothetical protein [Francisella philomiragia]MBK2105529.1 hypothetical protein [Francisella philomiragia]